MEREVRTLLDASVAVEERDEGKKPVIAGYAAVFNQRTEIGGWFTESISPDAFTRALQDNSLTRALFNHDANIVLGRAKNGTLVMRTDSKGLWTETTPPDTQQARDVVENIRVGNIDGMSFAFTIAKQQWTMSEDPAVLDHRDILEIGDLYDVGPVTYPAYEQTQVGIRASAERLHKEARSAWEAARKENDSPIITFSGYHPEAIRKKVVALNHKIRAYSL